MTSEIATGELVVVIVPPDAESFGSGNTIFTQAAGSYGGKLQFKATPSEQEPFDPGQVSKSSTVVFFIWKYILIFSLSLF